MTDFRTIETEAEALQALGVNEQQVRDYFLRVEKVMHFLIKASDYDAKTSEGHWASGINPYYNQLDLDRSNGLGLALVEYYGMPSALATPFGSITFVNGGRVSDDWFAPARDVLDLKPIWGERGECNENEVVRDAVRPVYVEHIGEFGPVWMISNDIDGKPFDRAYFAPQAVGIPNMQHSNSLSYEVVKSIWSACAPEGFRVAKAALNHRLAALCHNEPA